MKLEWLRLPNFDAPTFAFCYIVNNSCRVVLQGEEDYFFGATYEDCAGIAEEVFLTLESRGWVVRKEGYVLVAEATAFSTNFFVDMQATEVPQTVGSTLTGTEREVDKYKGVIVDAIKRYEEACRGNLSLVVAFKKVANKVCETTRFNDTDLVTLFNLTVALFEQSRLYSSAASVIEKKIVQKILRGVSGKGDLFAACIFEFVSLYAEKYNSGGYPAPTLAGLSYQANRILLNIGRTEKIVTDEQDRF